MNSFCQTLRFLFFVCFAATWCYSPGLADNGNGTKIFRAGAAKCNITPPLGTSLAGSMRDRRATHVHDDLYARSLVLDDGETRIAIVVCDLVALGKEPIHRAKQLIRKNTDIPPDRVLVAATHTHTAPTTVHVFQSEPDREYIDWLVVRIADSVRLAVNNLRPARIGWGLGQEDRVVFNRRYFMKPGTMPPNPWGRTNDRVKMNPGYENPNVVKPAGPIDPDLSILAIEDYDDEPIAVLGNYTLHYVGGGKGSDVSADYFGMWADILEREFAGPSIVTKPPFVAILTNGCSGDINNVDVRHRLKQPHPYHQMLKVARIAADEGLRVLKDVRYHEWVPLSMREMTVELGVRKPTQREVREAQRILSQGGQELKSLKEIYARETVLLASKEDRIRTPIQALGIGDVGIVTFPGEAFVELGLEIKEKSPFPLTFCIELANDYTGYIPTSSGHKQGGYETWRARSSFLEPDAAPVMVSTALDLLRQIHESREHE